VIILGIDPGSRYTGWGVIEASGSRLKFLGANRLVLGDGDHDKRLVLIYDQISDIVSTYKPDIAILESVFVSKNVQSALKLGQARGASMVAIARQGVPITEVSPRAVKKTVTGYGGATKMNVGDMVSRLLSVNVQLSVDAWDALAIAISGSSLIRSKI